MDDPGLMNRQSSAFPSHTYNHLHTSPPTSRLDNMMSAASGRNYLPADHLPPTQERYEYHMAAKRPRYEETHSSELAACAPQALYPPPSKQCLKII